MREARSIQNSLDRCTTHQQWLAVMRRELLAPSESSASGGWLVNQIYIEALREWQRGIPRTPLLWILDHIMSELEIKIETARHD